MAAWKRGRFESGGMGWGGWRMAWKDYGRMLEGQNDESKCAKQGTQMQEDSSYKSPPHSHSALEPVPAIPLNHSFNPFSSPCTSSLSSITQLWESL